MYNYNSYPSIHSIIMCYSSEDQMLDHYVQYPTTLIDLFEKALMEMDHTLLSTTSLLQKIHSRIKVLSSQERFDINQRVKLLDLVLCMYGKNLKHIYANLNKAVKEQNHSFLKNNIKSLTDYTNMEIDVEDDSLQIKIE